MSKATSPGREGSASPVPYAVSRYKQSRHWAIHDPEGALVCVALYKKGAAEVAKRLSGSMTSVSNEEGRSHENA